MSCMIFFFLIAIIPAFRLDLEKNFVFFEIYVKMYTNENVVHYQYISR